MSLPHRLRIVSAIVLSMSCATAVAPPFSRTYDASPPQSLALIREAMAKRGIQLKETDDPNVLVSEPLNGQTPVSHEYSNDNAFQLNDPTMRSRDLNRWAKDRTTTIDEGNAGRENITNFGAGLKYGPESSPHEIRFRVTVKPTAGGGSTVLVERSDRFGWQSNADYNSIGAWDPTMVANQQELSKLETRGAPPYWRDPEMEAVVSQVLDGQVDLQINDGEASNALVAPLPVSATTAPDAPAERFAQAAGACIMKVERIAPMIAAGHVVMLSDPMGANESWRAVQAVLCLAEKSATPVTLALGIPRSEQDAVNAYLGSEGSDADRHEVLSMPFWNREWQDGRSSQAVFEVLEMIRVRRQAGAKITVLAYEPNSMTGNVRQGSIASLLLRHREAFPSHLIVFVHGNVSVSKMPGTQWDEGFLSVGARLHLVLPAKTHAFDIAYDRGDHWTCRSDNGSIRCGTWMATPGPAQTRTGFMLEPAFEVFEKLSPDGFDGVMYVGPLTTALPALAEKFRDQGHPDYRAKKAR